MNLEQPTACVQAQDQECVGQQLTNYIYKLTSSKNHQSVPNKKGWITHSLGIQQEMFLNGNVPSGEELGETAVLAGYVSQGS